jgi:hypothetical protein
MIVLDDNTQAFALLSPRYQPGTWLWIDKGQLRHASVDLREMLDKLAEASKFKDPADWLLARVQPIPATPPQPVYEPPSRPFRVVSGFTFPPVGPTSSGFTFGGVDVGVPKPVPFLFGGKTAEEQAKEDEGNRITDDARFAAYPSFCGYVASRNKALFNKNVPGFEADMERAKKICPDIQLEITSVGWEL